MFLSMTGFSRVYREAPWGTLTVEISSVNSRYLEVSVRGSRELISEEPMIQSALKKSLSRGKVQVRMELAWGSQLRVGRINIEVIKNYYDQLREFSISTGSEGVIPVESLLSLPGVTEPTSLVKTIDEEVSPVLGDMIQDGISELIEMRGKEGEILKKDIVSHLNDYEEILSKIDVQWKESFDKALESQKEKFKAVMEQYTGTVDEARLAQELVIMSDKWDVSEEISRSYGHLEQFKKLLNGDSPVGRKLDFLLQEMNREINTMGSKVGDSEIRWLVVEGKACLERIREQVQNVE